MEGNNENHPSASTDQEIYLVCFRNFVVQFEPTLTDRNNSRVIKKSISSHPNKTVTFHGDGNIEVFSVLYS
jgi:hypothetical protein